MNRKNKKVITLLRKQVAYVAQQNTKELSGRRRQISELPIVLRVNASETSRYKIQDGFIHKFTLKRGQTSDNLAIPGIGLWEDRQVGHIYIFFFRPHKNSRVGEVLTGSVGNRKHTYFFVFVFGLTAKFWYLTEFDTPGQNFVH